MTAPSGDHTGSDENSCTSRTGVPPSSGTLKTWIASPSRTPMPTHCPSGDQDGAPRTSSESAISLTLLPSAFAHDSAERLPLRTTMQNALPLGDTAGAAAIAPWLGFQSSLAPAGVDRQSSSAPPRDAKYQSVESGAKRGAAERAVGNVRRLALASA